MKDVDHAALAAIEEAARRLQKRVEKGLYKPGSREQVRKDLEFEVFMVEHGHTVE